MDPLHDPSVNYSVREWPDGAGHTYDAVIVIETDDAEAQLIFHDVEGLLDAGHAFLQAAQTLEIATQDGIDAITTRKIPIPVDERTHPNKTRLFGLTDQDIKEFMEGE